MKLVWLGAVVAVLAVGAASASPARWIPTAGCDDAAQIPDEQPPPPDSLVLGRVSLPSQGEVLQLGGPFYRGGPRFAKQGVSVTAGAPVVLEVPRRYRRVYGLAFGSVGGRNLGAAAVRLRPCPSSSALWTSWAGGYLARRPACVPLVVRANGRAVRIRLSLGRRCPDS